MKAPSWSERHRGLVFYGSLVLGFGCQLLFDVHVLNLPYVLLLIVLPLVVIFFREPLGKLMAGEKDWKPEKGRVHHPELFRGIRNPAVLCIQHHVLPAGGRVRAGSRRHDDGGVCHR